MKRIINIGIIGCGYWGPNFVRNFSKINGVSVKRVCDLSYERLEHLRFLYPRLDLTTNYSNVLKDKDIDAVVISTPAVTHYKLAKESLAFGKHVLIEKPITTKI